MEYSDDILARIRAALIDFHAATHSNGRKRSWSLIAGDIHEAGLDLPEEDESFGDPFKPLAEALRRFATGSQVPSKERLDALCAYLKSRSFLSDADLQPAATANPLVHALTAFFGARAQTRDFNPLHGRFAASRKLPSGRTELSVMDVRYDGTHAPVVEDKIYSLPTAPQSTKRDALARLLKRFGGSEQRFDGWLFRNNGQACLVVQDSLRGDPSIYTILDMKTGEGHVIGTMMLVKSLDFGAPAAGYEKQTMRLLSASAGLPDPFTKITEKIWAYRREGDPHAP